MNRLPLQSALRELRTEFRRPLLWAALAGIGVVMALAGAFETGSVMRFVPRVLYWVALAVLSYGLGSFLSFVLRPMLTRWPRLARVTAIGLAIGVAVTALIAAINTALFGLAWTYFQGFAGFAGTVIATALVITLVLHLASQSTHASPGATSDAPALLARLPVEKRGALVSLSAVDHYVEVTTHAGSALVLMRLSDAIAETAPVAGLRIHRSHWVAQEAVTRVVPGTGKADVQLSDGRTLPVSRANLPALKASGLMAEKSA